MSWLLWLHFSWPIILRLCTVGLNCTGFNCELSAITGCYYVISVLLLAFFFFDYYSFKLIAENKLTKSGITKISMQISSENSEPSILGLEMKDDAVTAGAVWITVL